MERLTNKLKKMIDTVDDLSISSESDGTCCIRFGDFTLVDWLDSEAQAQMLLERVRDFYNRELWLDQLLLGMLIRYQHHIELYNKEGWKTRGDFNTPELYQAFVYAQYLTIKKYIEDKLTDKFSALPRITSDGVWDRLNKVSDEDTGIARQQED